MSEGDVQIMVAPPSDGTLTFCNRRGWVVKVTAEGRLGFNREAFPELDADGFAKEFVESLESWVPGMSANAQRWTPVGERLPEPGRITLIWGGDEVLFFGMIVGEYSGEGLKWWVGDEIYVPSYWMPLPEPPK